MMIFVRKYSLESMAKVCGCPDPGKRTSGVKTTVTVARLLICLVLLASLVSANAEDLATPVNGVAATLTPDTVKEWLEELEAATNLDEKTKATLTKLYRKTLRNLEQERASTEASAAFTKARKTAPAEARAVRKTLEKFEQESPTVTLDVSEDTPLAEIEQKLLDEKANQAAVDAKLDKLEKQLTTEVERPTAIRQRISEARQSQEKIDSQLKQAAPAGELLKLTEARQWNLTAQLRALSAELKMLDQELLSRPMRIKLMQAQRDRMERNHNRLTTRVSMLNELLGQQRLQEAEQAKLEAEAVAAKAEIAGKHPLIRQHILFDCDQGCVPGQTNVGRRTP